MPPARKRSSESAEGTETTAYKRPTRSKGSQASHVDSNCNSNSNSSISSNASSSSRATTTTAPSTTSANKGKNKNKNNHNRNNNNNNNNNRSNGASSQDKQSSQSATEIDEKTDDDFEYEVEKVVDKKIYKNKVWYKLKWVGWVEPTWELAKDCKCEQLIREYEKMIEEQSKDEDENEWEVEEILDKRVKDGEVEYLLKWKNWHGGPTWTRDADCDCINLIAAYENPKLKKMWDYSGSNTRLWLDRQTIIRYMRDYARSNNYDVNLLEFEPDFPPDEKPHELREGLNIGPLCYKNHWYLVIIVVNYICITKKLLICDPLNTLIGVSNTRVHPVFKRMTKVYPSFTMTPVAMTPMERSDTCAFHLLAAYERALFCMRKDAKFIVNKLFFDRSTPELIRTRTAPHTDREISANLMPSSCYLDGPKCEFCGLISNTTEAINDHIIDEHFTKDSTRHSQAGSIIYIDEDLNEPSLSDRKRCMSSKAKSNERRGSTSSSTINSSSSSSSSNGASTLNINNINNNNNNNNSHNYSYRAANKD